MIPIYRAKKIDSDEFVEGYLVVLCDRYHIYWKSQKYIVDPSTLAIHFPDMIDSEGTKIFASLSEDGKGGDIVESMYIPWNTGGMGAKLETNTAIYKERSILHAFNANSHGVKVTGIQE